MGDVDDITLARAKKGDHRAFRALVVAFERPVHALIGRMLIGVGSSGEVEELAQETFLRVYRALPGFESRGPGRLKKWVLTIATRVTIDSLRSRRMLSRPLMEERTAGADRADDLAKRRVLASALAQAVAALPEDQRAVFLLREYHGFDYDEMAKALEVNVGTVKSRLSRARAALREALREVAHVGQG